MSHHFSLRRLWFVYVGQLLEELRDFGIDAHLWQQELITIDDEGDDEEIFPSVGEPSFKNKWSGKPKNRGSWSVETKMLGFCRVRNTSSQCCGPGAGAFLTRDPRYPNPRSEMNTTDHNSQSFETILHSVRWIADYYSKRDQHLCTVPGICCRKLLHSFMFIDFEDIFIYKKNLLWSKDGINSGFGFANNYGTNTSVRYQLSRLLAITWVNSFSF